MYLRRLSDKKAGVLRIQLLVFAAYCLLSVIFPFWNLFNSSILGIELFTHPTSACPVLNIFDIPCAFCGMSRSFTAMLNFDFASAVYYNPASVVVLPAGSVIYSLVFIMSFRNKQFAFNSPLMAFGIILAVFAAIWILNIFLGHQ